MTKPRLGIILTPNVEIEINHKNERWSTDSKKRPWLANIDRKYVVDDYTTSDVSIAYYLKYKYSDLFETVFLMGDTVTDADLKKNDLNLTYIYGVNTSYAENSLYVYKQYTGVLKRARNMFPGFNIMNLVSNKPGYYQYLQERGIRVNKFYYIDSKTFIPSPYTEFAKVKQFLKENRIDTYIIKPKYGSCSSGLLEFNGDTTDTYIINQIDILCRKYPGVIVMKKIDGFKEIGEYKVYFINGKPNIVLNITGENESRLIDINTEDPHVRALIEYSVKVYNTLPTVNIKGVKMPYVYIRIDLSCCLDNNCCVTDVDKYFVNEVEFVASPVNDQDYEENGQPEITSRMDVEIAEATKDMFMYYLSQPHNDGLSLSVYIAAFLTFMLFTLVIYKLFTMKLRSQ